MAAPSKTRLIQTRLVQLFSLFIAFIGLNAIILWITVQMVCTVRMAKNKSIETAVDVVDNQVVTLSQKHFSSPFGQCIQGDSGGIAIVAHT